MSAQPSLGGSVETFGGERARELLDPVREIYAEVFAEPPYEEGPKDVASFAGGWVHHTGQPGFRLALATAGERPVGFAFGHPLGPSSRFWQGFLDPPDAALTHEPGGRTFALFELAVVAWARRDGWGRALHDALLRNRSESRVGLLCRPEATTAQAAYRSWGYRSIGRIRPVPHAPVYDALVRPLPHG